MGSFRRLTRLWFGTVAVLGFLWAGLASSAHAVVGDVQSRTPRIVGSPRAVAPLGIDKMLLEGFGWSGCATPITWSVDLRNLESESGRRELRNLEWAFREWSLATGLNFTYVGELPVSWTESTRMLLPTGDVPLAQRHILIGFLTPGESNLLGKSALGFGGPSFVLVSRKEIVDGAVVVNSDFINAERAPSLRMRKSLYLHEIGHALGLGHSTDSPDLMFSTITRTIEISKPDRRAALSSMVPCGAPSDDSLATGQVVRSR